MNKETKQHIKAIAKVTAAGTAEGALIGFSVGGPGGAIVMGGVGTLSALAAELSGRLHTSDLTVAYSIHRDPAPTPQQKEVTKTFSFNDVPKITQPDLMLQTLIPQVFIDLIPAEHVRQFSLDIEQTVTDSEGTSMTDRNGITWKFPTKGKNITSL